MRAVVHFTEKDLQKLERDDIDKIVASLNQIYNCKTRKDFVSDIKRLWKTLFPDKDERGRYDETKVPYVVRHLSSKVDKSRENGRKDKITFQEFEKIVSYFSDHPVIQCYLTLSMESLGRPSELFYLKIGDVEFFDNYAKIFVNRHGKEGRKLMRCIDSYFYLQQWLNKHPMRNDPDAWLFLNTKKRQFNPIALNKYLRRCCKKLSIKHITCYSIKRNGITFARLRGDSDLDIQHRAGWTSTRQLQVYDLSNQEDSFNNELVKRGLKSGKENQLVTSKTCVFCNTNNGIAVKFCTKCRRPLDREHILREEKELRARLERLEKLVFTPQLIKEAQKIILEIQETKG